MSRKTASTDRPTGEDLISDPEDYSYIPGASQFFKLDANALNLDNYIPADGLPSNPQDYLKSVMIEARNCPDVVVAKINPNKIRKQTTINVPSHESLPGHELDPAPEWCEMQVKHFCHARAEYSRHLAHLKSIKRQTKKRPKLPIYPLPSPDDVTNWRYICLGNKFKPIDQQLSVEDSSDVVMAGEIEAQQEVNGPVGECANEDADNETPDNPNSPGTSEDRVVDLSLLEKGFTPMLRILLRMEPKHVEANLEYHVQWLKTYGFSHQQGRWMYALLVSLEKPLYPTVISNLRNLARECARLRESCASSSGNELKGLNLIICIVAKYYDQSDLVDTS